jgi:hypothetical protein
MLSFNSIKEQKKIKEKKRKEKNKAGYLQAVKAWVYAMRLQTTSILQSSIFNHIRRNVT